MNPTPAPTAIHLDIENPYVRFGTALAAGFVLGGGLGGKTMRGALMQLARRWVTMAMFDRWLGSALATRAQKSPDPTADELARFDAKA